MAESVIAEPGLLKDLLQCLESPTARVKFGAGKVLRTIAEQCPEVLYPHFELFARMLEHENKIFQWEAIFVLARLAGVDKQGKWEQLFDRYFGLVTGAVMITAANVIVGAARVALARPEWADRIAQEILKVSQAHYATSECRNVAIGHAITSFGEFYELLENPEVVKNFVRDQLKNPRHAVQRKAEAFLKRLGRKVSES